MSKTRLGVVFGGRSVEHEVSVVSAMELLADADPARFETVPFGVTRAGRWLTPDETRAQLDRADALFEKRIDADVPPLGERPEVIREVAGVDAVFPLIHGVNGEDGTLQGMLEMLGVPVRRLRRRGERGRNGQGAPEGAVSARGVARRAVPDGVLAGSGGTRTTTSRARSTARSAIRRS